MIGLEVLTGKDRLTIHQCEALAKQMHGEIAFDLNGPKGSMQAKWLDPWFGFFTVEGHEGFMTTKQLEFADVWCTNVRPANHTEEEGDA